MTAPSLLTYPARPIQGGRLELAPPKRGLGYAEPKLNGWRGLIHTPTGAMWNRHGALLTIAKCFRPALGALAKLASRGLVWADCEALAGGGSDGGKSGGAGVAPNADDRGSGRGK